MSHIDEELISAYVDNALGENEHSEVLAHLDACSECALVAERFRRLRELAASDPAPELSDTDAKRLEKQIGKLLRRKHQLWRAVVAVGGTAAAMAAFVMITLGGGGESNVAADNVVISVENTNYSQEMLAADLFGSSPQTRAQTEAQAAPLAVEPSLSRENFDADLRPSVPTENHGARIAQCENVIRPGGRSGAVAILYIIAKYEGVPAYILEYETPRENPTHRLVLVVARSDCSLLYKAEQPLTRR